MLAAWLSDNKTQDWSQGLRLVHNQKNYSYHSGIKSTQYAALLEEDPKHGLNSTSLPQEVIDCFETKKYLFVSQGVQPLTEPTDESVQASEPAIISTQPPQAFDEPVTISTKPSQVLDEQVIISNPPSLDLSPHIASIQEEIYKNRKSARAAQVCQAKRMVKRSRINLKVREIGDNVAVPVTHVDRRRGDPRNLLGIIMDRNEKDLYTIGVKAGRLKTEFTRIEFKLCPK
ncbi:uncharacterized protein [Palaemon carinicauda]|uniref:uncharacterized protein n=1 Tax=Palaemon carinicauda TaxID=392227 RepID=UPI0035B673CF